MGLRLEDLPPAMRAQVVAAGAVKGSRPRNNAGKGATTTDGTCECGTRFTSTTKWEAHSDQLGAGHKRFVLVQQETS